MQKTAPLSLEEIKKVLTESEIRELCTNYLINALFEERRTFSTADPKIIDARYSRFTNFNWRYYIPQFIEQQPEEIHFGSAISEFSEKIETVNEFPQIEKLVKLRTVKFIHSTRMDYPLIYPWDELQKILTSLSRSTNIKTIELSFARVSGHPKLTRQYDDLLGLLKKDTSFIKSIGFKIDETQSKEELTVLIRI